MGDPAKKPATCEDLCAVPDNLVAELLSGELHTQPRPGAPCSRAVFKLGGKLSPFDDEDGDGPGGWIILSEAELHLGADVLVPDLVGWRRVTMPEMPEVNYFETRPDWVCEILSPSTAIHDRGRKMPVYAAHGVPHIWLVDPAAKSLEILSTRRRWISGSCCVWRQ